MPTNFKRRVHRGRLHKEMQLPDKIPADHSATYYNIPVYSDCLIAQAWGNVTVIVRKGSRKSSSHRVFIKCPCERLIPAGRYHQHAGACAKSL